jgi:predicted dehydrogenase
MGRFGRIHAQVVRSTPGVTLSAVCARTAENAAAAAAETQAGFACADYRELLARDDVDVVTIATHWKDHFEIARTALERGKHVLLEKPMAANSDECRELTAAAQRAAGFFMVGHVCRFDPRVVLAKQAIDEGRIGRIISMHAKRNLPFAPGPLRLDKISPLMGDGVHDADLMMWFLGRAPSRVYARCVRVDDFAYPDLGWAMLEFGDLSNQKASRENGALGVIETVWRLPANTPTTIDATLEVIGTEGQLTIDCGHAGLAILDSKGLKYPDTAYWPEVYGQRMGALAQEIAYFAQCVREEKRPEVITPPEAARAVMVMEAAERAAAIGAPQEFQDAWPAH